MANLQSFRGLIFVDASDHAHDTLYIILNYFMGLIFADAAICENLTPRKFPATWYPKLTISCLVWVLSNDDDRLWLVAWLSGSMGPLYAWNQLFFLSLWKYHGHVELLEPSSHHIPWFPKGWRRSTRYIIQLGCIQRGGGTPGSPPPPRIPKIMHCL
jgi:hypothetical protein